MKTLYDIKAGDSVEMVKTKRDGISNNIGLLDVVIEELAYTKLLLDRDTP